MTNPYQSPHSEEASDDTKMPQTRRSGPPRKLTVKCPECNCTLKGATTAMVGDLGVCTHCKAEFEIRPQYTTYDEVPWHRRSSVNSIFILVHFFTGGCMPLILVTCVNLVTGDIYYNEKDEDGVLETWGIANKLLAVVILSVNALVLLSVVLSTLFGQGP